MRKLTLLLKNSSVFQRIFYFVLLCLYNFLIFNNRGTKGNSSIGIPFIWFWIIPTIIMVFQVLFNNVYGWFVFVILYLIYFVWLIISIIQGIILESDEWKFDYYFYILLLILSLLCFGWIILKIKPLNK